MILNNDYLVKFFSENIHKGPVVYDDKNLYYIIKYSDLKRLSGWEERYFSALKRLYEENTARCIKNLFFDIRTKFNYFHMNHHITKFSGFPNDDKGRLFHCSIIVQNKDYELVKNTLELVYLKYNFGYSLFEDDIDIIKIKGGYIFNISICLFYHLLNPLLFGHKVPILVSVQNKGDECKFIIP